jgi:CRISPR-associated endoribonuclease Cas6
MGGLQEVRLLIVFRGKENFKVPISYNEVLQGFIYRHLHQTIAEFLHDRGVQYKKRVFKLFTFSRLLGRLKPDGDVFHVQPPVSLIVSSPYTEVLQDLAENLLKNPEVSLAGQSLQVESISVELSPLLEGPVEIRMLSPVTVYSTLQTPSGKKKTYYYNPKEEEFSLLLRENILKKYRAFYGREPEGTEFIIEPLRVSKRDEKIVTYKGFVIKGWMGRYRLDGSPELLRLAYDAGLGAKNSQGFGCFEVVGIT